MKIKETGKRKRYFWCAVLLGLALCFQTAQATSAHQYNCEAGDHCFETVITDPTEDTAGQIRYTCTICGYTYTEEIPAWGHSYGEWETIVEPSCLTSGTARRTCSKCGVSEEKELPAYGTHDYEVTERNGMRIYTCRRCGDTYEEKTSVTTAGETEVKSGDVSSESLPESEADTLEVLPDDGGVKADSLPDESDPEDSKEKKDGRLNVIDAAFAVAGIAGLFLLRVIYINIKIILWDRARWREFRKKAGRRRDGTDV